MIGLAMVTYSDLYEKPSGVGAWWSIVSSSAHYYFRPTAKAKRFIEMTQSTK
jgi:hypothetical protein